MSAGSRNVRGIAARPANGTGSGGATNAATPPNSQPPTPGPAVTPTTSADAENIKSMSVTQTGSLVDDKEHDVSIIMDTSSVPKAVAAGADSKPVATTINIPV